MCGFCWEADLIGISCTEIWDANVLATHWRFLERNLRFRFHPKCLKQEDALWNMVSICFTQLPVRWRNWDAPTIHFLLFVRPQICASICEICGLRYSGYGYNPMGCNQMGNQMGCNQMNFNQMNYNQMGQMGYNQMACNQMGCGQVWASQQWTIALTMKDKVFWFHQDTEAPLKGMTLLK